MALKFGLYRIPVNSGFDLHRFHGIDLLRFVAEHQFIVPSNRNKLYQQGCGNTEIFYLSPGKLSEKSYLSGQNPTCPVFVFVL